MSKLNIVIPIYNERDNLEELYQRLSGVCDNLNGISCQIIYVNDGSSDDSMKIILEQCSKDSRFTLIELSRNFYGRGFTGPAGSYP